VNEILQSSARATRTLNATVLGVAVVSIIATASSAAIMIWTQAFWLALAAPSAAIAAAVVTAVLVQRRAVRRHKALCDAGGR
jgi:hypothetical protein